MPFSIERIPALTVEHFQQNGNLKNIAHIDESNNEIAPSGIDLPKKVLNSLGGHDDISIDTIGNDQPAAAGTGPDIINIPVDKEVIEVEIIPKGYSLIRFPKEKSCFRKIMWFVLWPIHFLFMLTIPDCERPSLKKLFPLTFIMCIVWIGSLSYMVAWMITIIGVYFFSSHIIFCF